MFSRAIFRTPCQAMVRGLSTAGLGVPDYRKALAQQLRGRTRSVRE